MKSLNGNTMSNKAGNVKKLLNYYKDYYELIKVMSLESYNSEEERFLSIISLLRERKLAAGICFLTSNEFNFSYKYFGKGKQSVFLTNTPDSCRTVSEIFKTFETRIKYLQEEYNSIPWYKKIF